MTPKFEGIRGRFEKLFGKKGEQEQVSGEFTAKSANPKEDERKMKKVLENQEAAETGETMQTAERSLQNFVNYDSMGDLFDFFYSLVSLKDMAKIGSFIKSLPSSYLAHISDQHLEKIRRELNESFKPEGEDKEWAMESKRDLEVLEKLAQAVDDAR